MNAAVIYFYVSNFQNVDEEEYGGMWEITKEGFMTSFAGFLVRFSFFYLEGILYIKGFDFVDPVGQSGNC